MVAIPKNFVQVSLFVWFVLLNHVVDELSSYYCPFRICCFCKFEDYEIDGETYTWFKNKYKDWKEAFRIASDNGAVIFH